MSKIERYSQVTPPSALTQTRLEKFAQLSIWALTGLTPHAYVAFNPHEIDTDRRIVTKEEYGKVISGISTIFHPSIKSIHGDRIYYDRQGDTKIGAKMLRTELEQLANGDTSIPAIEIEGLYVIPSRRGAGNAIEVIGELKQILHETFKEGTQILIFGNIYSPNSKRSETIAKGFGLESLKDTHPTFHEKFGDKPGIFARMYTIPHQE